MFIKIETQENQYTRLSKSGIEHSYKRKKTLAVFRCDNCDTGFMRDLKHVDRKRLSNNYFHCCPNCDAKRFAQRKGVEQKQIWDLPASTTLPVGKY
jgi:Zn finger protein HypA/HybF involved in hydrogenase expression